MLLQLQVWSLWLLQQDAAVGWDVRSLWGQMGPLAKVVVIGLFFMSAWSIGVVIDRFLAYNAARKPSPVFAPPGAGAVGGRKLGAARQIGGGFERGPCGRAGGAVV